MNKGDRVITLSPLFNVVDGTRQQTLPAGELATVLESAHGCPWLQFDSPTGFPDSAAGGRAGYCSCVNTDRLRVVP